MEFKDNMEKLSYTLGINVAEYLGSLPVKVNMEIAAKAIADAAGGKPAITPEEYHANMQEFQKMMQESTQQELAKLVEKNQQEEMLFLTSNAAKQDVQSTASGLQYKVLTEGKGTKPTAESKVKVHYTGKMLNNQVFDSSVQRGEPAVFGVNQVIPGWTEALQMMTPGSKYELYIPSKLAYGERGAGNAIPPCAMLIFEVELIEIMD